jgi:hypothetical protein
MEFTQQELLQLREFIDVAVRARGLEVAEAAVRLARKLVLLQRTAAKAPEGT